MASAQAAFVFVMFLAMIQAAIEDMVPVNMMPQDKCVPAAVVRGLCRQCVCTIEGVYHCRTVRCRPTRSHWSGAECEPLVMYRTENSNCECSRTGQWQSGKCSMYFHIMQPKANVISQPATSKLGCKPGSIYVAGCNLCACPSNGVLNIAKCSNRHCINGHKASKCHYGDALRTVDELCFCSEVNFFVDRLCIAISNRKFYQRIRAVDAVNLIDIGREWNKKPCVDGDIYWNDCNRCVCVHGNMMCPTNTCSPMTPVKKKTIVRRMSKDQIRTSIAIKKETSNSSTPDLDIDINENQSCIPGRTYRIKCNTCACSLNGQLMCTTMECFDYKTYATGNSSNSLPVIREGESCVKGRVYRMACNTCHCVQQNNLVCSKMACLDAAEIKKLGLIEKKTSKKTKTRQGLAESPKTNCTPGKFYKKGCRQCFCEDNGKPMCSNITNCKDVNTAPTSPAALRVYSAQEFELLQSLSHQAAPCKPGVTYRIDCNTCLCLASGNLACEKLLCPSYEDVNRLNAKNISGVPCTESNVDGLGAECIRCACENNKTWCAAVPGCVASTSRRQLHGNLNKETVWARDHLNLQQQDCLPGMVYREGCNKCYCQKDQSVRCTQKTCLNYNQVVRLKKLRLHLEKNGL